MNNIITLALALVILSSSGCQSTGSPPAAKEKPEKEPQRTLYDRLGGEGTIVAVVDDLVPRAMADTKLNFTRKGTPRAWQPTPEYVARLKTRLVQLLCTATGGPQRYEGEDMRTAHRGMRISAAEFGAFVTDVEQSLEAAGVKEKERKEVLEIIKSAKGTVVEQPPSR
jgi:hemoglobin